MSEVWNRTLWMLAQWRLKPCTCTNIQYQTHLPIPWNKRVSPNFWVVLCYCRCSHICTELYVHIGYACIHTLRKVMTEKEEGSNFRWFQARKGELSCSRCEGNRSVFVDPLTTLTTIVPTTESESRMPLHRLSLTLSLVQFYFIWIYVHLCVYFLSSMAVST